MNAKMPVRIMRPLTEDEADEARYDGCQHYFDCLEQGLVYWRCHPRCEHYIAPKDRTSPALNLKDMEGIALLLEYLFPNFDTGNVLDATSNDNHF